MLNYFTPSFQTKKHLCVMVPSSFKYGMIVDIDQELLQTQVLNNYPSHKLNDLYLSSMHFSIYLVHSNDLCGKTLPAPLFRAGSNKYRYNILIFYSVNLFFISNA